jgi:hypothetical protein
VIVKSYCHFNINDAGAIKLSPCMPGLGQGFAGVSIDLCLTARFARGTEIAEENIFPFSADPGGIGSAFHRAEDGRKGKDLTLRVSCLNLSDLARRV